MRWKIKHLEFCEQSRSLKDDKNETYLEPLLAEMLSYFCHHAGEVVDRDRLVEEVWDAKAVTDNAVSRVVAKLRKALGDDSKSPEFILTYPKKGYRFIADVSRLDVEAVSATAPEEDPKMPEPVKTHPEHRGRWIMAGTGVCLVALLLWQMVVTQRPAQFSVEALTRDGGRTVHAVFSPDGSTLAYSTILDGRMRLFLKNLETLEVAEIGDPDGFSGPASWSRDGRIVFLVTTTEGAFYYVGRVDGLVLSEKTLVHKGPPGSYGKAGFSYGGESLVLSEAEGLGQPYELYEIALDTMIKRRLPQPELVLGGNAQFDVHPSQNALLISAPNQDQWLDVYSLDMDTDELAHLFEVQEFTCCPIWDHDGRGVVLKGDYPARELIRFDLEGGSRAVLLRVPHLVSFPSRHPNGVDYVYEGGSLNRDIDFLPFEGDSQQRRFVNASVDDLLGVLSPDGQTLAFVSERSGQSEVWVRGVEATAAVKLTDFGDHRYFYDLQWSPDGAWLAGSTINQVDLISLKDRTVRRLELPHEERWGMSWRDATTLSFSMERDGRSRIFNYDISANRLEMYEGEETLVQHAPVIEDSIWIGEDGALFFGPQRTPVDWVLHNPLHRRRLNLLKRGDMLYQVRNENGTNHLVSYDIGKGEEKVLISEDMGMRFSVGEAGIYFSRVASYHSDIYRTIASQ